MQHRDGMRPRTIDDNKYYQVIKDIDNAKRTFPPEEKKEIEKYENDLIKAIQHFDNKKKIQTPKSLILEKNKLNNNLNEKNEKTEKIKEHTNNINSDIPVYELQEYKRPEHYIIYSSKERDQQKIKDYEAKYPDKVFFRKPHAESVGDGAVCRGARLQRGRRRDKLELLYRGRGAARAGLRADHPGGTAHSRQSGRRKPNRMHHGARRLHNYRALHSACRHGGRKNPRERSEQHTQLREALGRGDHHRAGAEHVGAEMTNRPSITEGLFIVLVVTERGRGR